MPTKIKTLKHSKSHIWPNGLTMWVYPEDVVALRVSTTLGIHGVNYEDIHAWCVETFGVVHSVYHFEGTWYRMPYAQDFVFKNKIDAAIFKMRWSAE